MKRISLKAKGVLAALGLVLAAAAGVTAAYYASQKQFENEFKVDKPGVAIVEKFNPSDHWVPGEEKSKEVWFTNTGEQDMLLRFSVEAEWAPGTVHPDREASDVVELYWNQGDGTREQGLPVSFTYFDQDGTGYYYYQKVLKAGTSTEHVLESVKFKTNLSNDGHENSDYSNTQINLTIKGETVLADEEAKAAAELWKVKGTISGDTVVWTAD